MVSEKQRIHITSPKNVSSKTLMAINYDYKSKSGERLMKQEAKRKAKFAQKNKPKEEMKMHDINKTITLDDITK